MIVGIQTSGIGKINMQTSGSKTDKTGIGKKDGNTFSDLMNLSATEPSKQVDVSKKQSVESVIASSSKKPDVKKQTDTSEQAETTNAKQPGREADTNDVKNTDTQQKANSTDDAVSSGENVDAAIKSIAQKIKKLLNIDDETLQTMLLSAGMTMQDLLNPDMLSQFFLQASGATPVDLLIDESLNKTMKDLLSALQDILNQNQLSQETVPGEIASGQEETSGIVDVNGQKAQNDQKAQMESTVSAGENVVEHTYHESDTQTETGTGLDESKIQSADVKVDIETDGTQSQNQGSNDNLTRSQEQVIGNLNQALDRITGADALTPAFDQTVARTDIVRQVVDQIKLNLSKDVTSMTVQLNPEQLGKVQIHVSTKDGVMQAQIIAENEAAKNAVESGIAVLKETFENQDLKVDAIEVMVGTQDYFAQGEENAQSQADTGEKQSGNRITGINLKDDSDDEISEEQKLEAEMMKTQGNQISYVI